MGFVLPHAAIQHADANWTAQFQYPSQSAPTRYLDGPTKKTVWRETWQADISRASSDLVSATIASNSYQLGDSPGLLPYCSY